MREYTIYQMDEWFPLKVKDLPRNIMQQRLKIRLESGEEGHMEYDGRYYLIGAEKRIMITKGQFLDAEVVPD